MIFKIKQWCEEIIIAIVISIIIEIMIPDGNNKKYTKVIIGIYIMFVMLSPILDLVNEEINLDIFPKYKYEETYLSMDNNIKDIYVFGIEESIKSDLENIGFEIEEVKVITSSNYEDIKKITLIIKNENIDKSQIYNYFHTNFLLDDNKIEIRSSQ